LPKTPPRGGSKQKTKCALKLVSQNHFKAHFLFFGFLVFYIINCYAIYDISPCGASRAAAQSLSARPHSGRMRAI
jgi:hypothetical protein